MTLDVGPSDSMKISNPKFTIYSTTKNKRDHEFEAT